MLRFIKQYNTFIQLIILIAISVVIIYFLPVLFVRFLFLLLLIPIWFTKKDYFWYAYIIIILNQPGGLFSGGLVNDVSRLPIYNLFPTVSFTFQEIYFFFIFIKGFLIKDTYVYNAFVYRKQYENVGILVVVLILISIPLGISLYSITALYKSIIALSIYVSVLYVFKNENDIINFFKLIFPFAVIAIMLQLYSIVNNQQIIALFKPDVTHIQGILFGEAMRPIELPGILFICFFGSLLYLGDKRQIFSDIYLLLINILSFISIIMTGTRSWFLGFLIIYLFYLFLNFKSVGKIFYRFILVAGLFFIIIYSFPLIGKQFNVGVKRLTTIELLFGGDITAGGSLSRISERGPRVMEGFWKSTIVFGAGYSNLFFQYCDGHVGNQNILLHSGIIGFLIIYSFAFTLFITPIRILKKVGKRFKLASIINNLPIFIPGVLMINTGTLFWGLTIDYTTVLIMAFFFTVSSIYIQLYVKQYKFELH